MPRFSKPKGVRTIKSPEWYYANGASCTGAIDAGVGNDAQVALFNNSNQGNWFFVWEPQIFTSGANYCYYFQINKQLGANFANALPILSGQPQPDGVSQTSSVPHVADFPGLTFPILNLEIETVWTGASGLFAVVKPGFSLVLQAEQNIKVSFLYTVIGP